MLAFTIRAIRRGGWRDPALFALVVLTVGGVNATALVFAGVAPLLWFPFAVWGTKEATLKRAAGAFVRIGALTLFTSLWWIAGLSVQSGYGIQILQYTETCSGRRVSRASHPNCCEASATGSSTAATASGRGSSRASSTRSDCGSSRSRTCCRRSRCSARP